jgi:hypothetical protein
MPVAARPIGGKARRCRISKQYDSLEPPSGQFAESDYGVNASFSRGNLAVGASLQGRFVEQRAHPEAACVAEITLSLEK